MNSNKRIVIACQTCGYLMKDISNAFVDAGYEVALLTSHDSINGIKDKLNKDIKTKNVISYDRSSSIKRIITWGFCALQMLFMIGLFYKKCSVLYVSNPPLGPLLPLLLKNRFSVLIWDIYPDVLVNKHVISEKNIIAKWWSGANRKVYKRAEHIFTISEGMKECLSAYVDEEKTKVIPLWPDNTNLHQVEYLDNLFIKNNHFEGKFIVMYSGNMGDTHRVDVLVDVAKRINDEDVLFVLIGEGSKKKLIEQRIANEGVKNVRLLSYQPYSFLSHSLSAADIAVITLDAASSKMSVPSKTFNMMSLGKPLLCIASPDSELGNIVRRYNVGDIFQPEETDEVVKFILKLKQDECERKRYSNNSLNASKHFCQENAKEYVKII